MAAYVDSRRIRYPGAAAAQTANEQTAPSTAEKPEVIPGGALRSRFHTWRKAIWREPYPAIFFACAALGALDIVLTRLPHGLTVPTLSTILAWWNEWTWLAILLLVPLVASIDTVYRLTIKLGEMQANVQVRGQLKLRVQVQKITSYGYYDKAFGGGCRGDRELTVDVYLTPSKPMTLDTLGLDLWGKRFGAEDLPVRAIKSETGYSIVMKIPRPFVVDTDKARVFARADGSEWLSEPFSVDFGVQKTAG